MIDNIITYSSFYVTRTLANGSSVGHVMSGCITRDNDNHWVALPHKRKDELPEENEWVVYPSEEWISWGEWMSGLSIWRMNYLRRMKGWFIHLKDELPEENEWMVYPSEGCEQDELSPNQTPRYWFQWKIHHSFPKYIFFNF